MSGVKFGIILVLTFINLIHGQRLCGSQHVCGHATECIQGHCVCREGTPTNPDIIHSDKMPSGRYMVYCRKPCGGTLPPCTTKRTCQIHDGSYVCNCAPGTLETVTKSCVGEVVDRPTTQRDGGSTVGPPRTTTTTTRAPGETTTRQVTLTTRSPGANITVPVLTRRSLPTVTEDDITQTSWSTASVSTVTEADTNQTSWSTLSVSTSTYIPDPGIAFGQVDEKTYVYILAGIGGAFAVLLLVLLIVCVSWQTENRSTEPPDPEAVKNGPKGIGNRPTLFDYSSPFPARQMHENQPITNGLEALSEGQGNDELSVGDAYSGTAVSNKTYGSEVNTDDSGHETARHSPAEATLREYDMVEVNPLYTKEIHPLRGIKPMVRRGAVREDNERLLPMTDDNGGTCDNVSLDNTSHSSDDTDLPSSKVTRL